MFTDNDVHLRNIEGLLVVEKYEIMDRLLLRIIKKRMHHATPIHLYLWLPPGKEISAYMLSHEAICKYTND